MKRDPYNILQVANHAEPEVIEAAYRRLARKYHPDQNPSANATAHMQDINWAYEILKDPAKRASYDRGVSPQAPPKPKPPPAQPKPKPPPPKPKPKPPPRQKTPPRASKAQPSRTSRQGIRRWVPIGIAILVIYGLFQGIFPLWGESGSTSADVSQPRVSAPGPTAVPTPVALETLGRFLGLTWNRSVAGHWKASFYGAKVEIANEGDSVRYIASYRLNDFIEEESARRFLCEAGRFHGHSCTRINDLMDRSLLSISKVSAGNLTMKMTGLTDVTDLVSEIPLSLTLTVRPAAYSPTPLPSPRPAGTVTISNPVTITNHPMTRFVNLYDNGEWWVLAHVPNGTVCNKSGEDNWDSVEMYEIECPELDVKGWVEAEWTE